MLRFAAKSLVPRRRRQFPEHRAYCFGNPRIAATGVPYLCTRNRPNTSRQLRAPPSSASWPLLMAQSTSTKVRCPARCCCQKGACCHEVPTGTVRNQLRRVATLAFMPTNAKQHARGALPALGAQLKRAPLPPRSLAPAATGRLCWGQFGGRTRILSDSTVSRVSDLLAFFKIRPYSESLSSSTPAASISLARCARAAYISACVRRGSRA